MLGIIISIIFLLLAISVHEFSHSWASDRLGDPTPRLLGRVTLNPLAHLDPIGTLLPVLLILSGSSFVFGWGKPAVFDPFNLRHPKRDSAIIALAGPASNLLLATICSVIIRLSGSLLLINLLLPFIFINVSLAVFNLLPIPPLDGSKILYGFLPIDWAQEYNSFMKSYGTLLLILMIIPIGGTSLAINLIIPVINLILKLLLPFSSLT
jgi:Zn-dependent protease